MTNDNEKPYHKFSDELVWRVCAYMRGKECQHCPHSFLLNDYGICYNMCRSLAEEMINVVETGDPWRRTPGH